MSGQRLAGRMASAAETVSFEVPQRQTGTAPAARIISLGRIFAVYTYDLHALFLFFPDKFQFVVNGICKIFKRVQLFHVKPLTKKEPAPCDAGLVFYCIKLSLFSI
jgi:hypothetical protein